MSRTIRRATVRHHRSWVLHELVSVDSNYPHLRSYLKWISLDPRSVEGKKKLAWYHSDAGFGDYSHKSPPHWYRRWCNKRFDRREEHLLLQWRDDDVVLPPRKTSANWYW